MVVLPGGILCSELEVQPKQHPRRSGCVFRVPELRGRATRARLGTVDLGLQSVVARGEACSREISRGHEGTGREHGARRRGHRCGDGRLLLPAERDGGAETGRGERPRPTHRRVVGVGQAPHVRAVCVERPIAPHFAWALAPRRRSAQCGRGALSRHIMIMIMMMHS